MVKLTFYGGVREIGGNKILLEDGEKKLLLDFGFPYQGYKRFYEEYLKPRGGAGLVDLLTMGLLPPLEGLYRGDLEIPGLWEGFRSEPAYRQLEDVSGVLLSHAHLDHSAHISLLKEEIPVYATAVTAFLVKAIQDSGKAGFDQQVCYFDPKKYGFPGDWKQAALLGKGQPKRQRQFCLADVRPEDLSAAALRFWGETGGKTGLDSRPLRGHGDGCFNLRCFPVDHSVPGACAWGIETSSGWVVYSGDLRWHGKRAGLTRDFVEQAGALRPHVLILEGTGVERETNVTEQEVYENALRAIAASDGLVVADFSPRDIDRLLTFRQIALETNRKLVVLPKDAYLLKAMRLLEAATPDVAHDDSLLIYQDTMAKTPDFWVRQICRECGDRTVLASDVAAAQGEFILCFSFFDLNELPSIRPGAGSLYVYSSSEPHDEEQEIDFRRLHQWLEHFKLKGFGLPVERRKKWLIPDEEQGLHASGHASGPDLLEIARQIAPEILIPVHSQKPGFYRKNLGGSGIKVRLPVRYGSIGV